jgi:hypothetical protein
MRLFTVVIGFGHRPGGDPHSGERPAAGKTGTVGWCHRSWTTALPLLCRPHMFSNDACGWTCTRRCS